MSLIKTIELNDATGELKDAYAKVIGERGKLSNILKIHSLLPKTMMTHLDFYMSVMFDKEGIRRADAELIATVVSAANNCDYCVNHHAEALKFYWKDEEKVKQAAEDFRKLDLTKRQNDFSDKEILSITLITNYFNFVNRVANALGVEFSEEEIKGYKY
jgi:uncharacterized peroxidase-related enzyme